MLSKLHSRLGTAGFIVAIVALIAAVAGTAFAATGLNSKQKKEVKAIAKSVAGPGAPGAPGPAGPVGPKGADGAPGAPGKDGAGVTTAPAEANECLSGGVKIITGSGATTKVCNGKDGAEGQGGGLPESLPPGETETGLWAFSEAVPVGPSGGNTLVPISFPIPLGEKIAGEHSHFLSPDGIEFLFDLDAGEIKERESTICTGDAAKPTAPPGHLCVYTSFLSSTVSGQSNFLNPETGNQGLNGEGITSSLSGALLLFEITHDAFGKAFGAWAVTECPEEGCA